MANNVLSVANVIEKNKIASSNVFLVLLDVDVIDPVTNALVETLYLVRNSEDIDYNGHTYTAARFEVGISATSGGQDSITLSIVDITQAVQARMQAYGGGTGFKVRVSVVNSGNLTQAPEILEHFEVVGANADAESYTCSFTLGTENSAIHQFPRRRQTKDFCQWRYKSPECGYTGSMPSCDYSLQGPNGCAAHNNTRNFGGFPGINNRVGTRG